MLQKIISFITELFSPTKKPEKITYSFVCKTFPCQECCCIDEWLNEFNNIHEEIVDMWISDIGDRMFIIVKVKI